MTIRILWMSAGRILPSQTQWLAQKFGKSVSTVQDPICQTAEDIALRMKVYDYVVVDATAIVPQLLEKGIKPLIPLMEQTDTDAEFFQVGENDITMGFRFVKFYRPISWQLNLEEI